MEAAIESLLIALADADMSIKAATATLADHRKRAAETKDRLAVYRKKRGELAAAIDRLRRSR